MAHAGLKKKLKLSEWGLTYVSCFQKGESIMVEVAKGGNTQEQLPMVLRVPHFNNESLSVCLSQFSLLGFGDILVPGKTTLFLPWIQVANRAHTV